MNHNKYSSWPSDQPEMVKRRFEDHYRLQRRIFTTLDRILSLAPSLGKVQASPIPTPQRLLLSNAGHLGDVIITTALLPVLHKCFPGLEIGFLTGSWALPVVHNHPLITRTHLLDHWYLRRDSASRLQKLVQYSLIDQKKIISELAEQKYDVAIDVRSWFPNFVPALWRANIPVRVGFDRVGFGPLLTHPFSHCYNRRHELEYQFELLQVLGVKSSALTLAHPSLPPVTTAAATEAKAIVGSSRRYRVLHVASSTPSRDWPSEHWQELARNLVAQGITPVLTGRGPRDAILTAKIGNTVHGCINSCDRLSWGGLVALIAGAELVYSVETSVGHVGAALQKPVVAIYGGMADPMHWKPYGDHTAVATRLLNCHPCFTKQGCSTRDCLTKLDVGAVTAMADRLTSKE